MIDTEKSSTIGSAATSIRDASERFGREARIQARETLHEMGNVYEQAGTWMQENYGKAIAVVGVAALIGVVGFVIGRNSQGTVSDITHRS